MVKLLKLAWQIKVETASSSNTKTEVEPKSNPDPHQQIGKTLAKDLIPNNIYIPLLRTFSGPTFPSTSTWSLPANPTWCSRPFPSWCSPASPAWKLLIALGLLGPIWVGPRPDLISLNLIIPIKRTYHPIWRGMFLIPLPPQDISLHHPRTLPHHHKMVLSSYEKPSHLTYRI